ncbi:hypothetical protein EZJ43_05450 [Pedobacter changchengzhani]|uniref:Uncharacterized protein n=1 Tax=Pedobacter changchengzhani TaxID=2529274 RepID=A0A4R5MLZ7_9SPHI|nr:hypothetical protein [Pedobacter changchengzhani]TDG36731.1 hypothetical protein EZJ43_05450 [Pedobacter changchengzhani]
MKNINLVLLLTIFLCACKESKMEHILIPRALQTGESFNEFPKSKVEIFNFAVVKPNANELLSEYQITFKDTVLIVDKQPKPQVTKFLNPTYLNSQKTAIVAQVADGTGLVSPFYIFCYKNNKLEAVALNKTSNGKNDAKVTKGLEKLSRASILIDNDYLLTTVNGKVFPIKRQEPNERIQGKIFMVSRDASTLIFLTANSLYQVNYLSNESFNLPLDSKMLNDESQLYNKVQQNYSWFKNANGTLFLKGNLDDNRIVDIKEFKK